MNLTAQASDYAFKNPNSISKFKISYLQPQFMPTN